LLRYRAISGRDAAAIPGEEHMNKSPLAALAVAGILALGATTSASAQWRGHHHGGHHWGAGAGIAAGVAAGALIGSAVAARPYGGYYAEPSYGYYQAPVSGYDYGYYNGPTSRSNVGAAYNPTPYSYYNCGGSYGQGRDCSAGDTGR
jgi:hypothetical protein